MIRIIFNLFLGINLLNQLLIILYNKIQVHNQKKINQR